MAKALQSGLLAVVLGVALGTSAWAAQPTSTTLSMGDKEFAAKAAVGGLAEVKLGQLAEQRGQSAQVKAFGHHMVMDHSKANAQLMAIAHKKHLAMPTDLGPNERATYDRLAKLSGERFDRAYMDNMAKDHQNDAREFQREAMLGKDGDLRQFASRTHQVIESHLKMAMSLDNSIKLGRMGGGGGHPMPRMRH